MSNLDIIPPNKSYNRSSYQIGMSLHQMRATSNSDTKSGYCTTKMKADKQSTIAHTIKMVIPSDFHNSSLSSLWSLLGLLQTKLGLLGLPRMKVGTPVTPVCQARACCYLSCAWSGKKAFKRLPVCETLCCVVWACL